MVGPDQAAIGASHAAARAVRSNDRRTADPAVREPERALAMGGVVSWRRGLDASPVAEGALALMRDATGRDEPLEGLVPVRPPALPEERCIGFWALNAGVGTSAAAAPVAHRSGAGCRPPVLIDLDRRAPTLSLRALGTGATLCDALLRPSSDVALLSPCGDIRL